MQHAFDEAVVGLVEFEPSLMLQALGEEHEGDDVVVPFGLGELPRTAHVGKALVEVERSEAHLGHQAEHASTQLGHLVAGGIDELLELGDRLRRAALRDAHSRVTEFGNRLTPRLEVAQLGSQRDGCEPVAFAARQVVIGGARLRRLGVEIDALVRWKGLVEPVIERQGIAGHGVTPGTQLHRSLGGSHSPSPSGVGRREPARGAQMAGDVEHRRPGLLGHRGGQAEV